MELLVTIAYFCLVWLIFYRFRLMRFNLFWKFVVFGLYAAAALTEVIVLGQTTPYSKEMVVERVVIRLAPEFGGLVAEVHAKPNEPMAKGDPIFSMDASPWKEKLLEAKGALASAEQQQSAVEAELAAAQRKLDDAVRLVPKQMMAAQELDIRGDRVDQLKAQISGIQSQQQSLKAELDEASYNLDHATIVAPADGYLVDLVLRPGAFIRLKQPVANFVSTEEVYLAASIDQRATQWIRPGDLAHFALSMYPGRIFKARVDSVVWASGRAQLQASGVLPTEQNLGPSRTFFVKLVPEGDFTQTPLEFGASGLTAIFTDKAVDLVKVLRMIEIQSESLLN
ncbi:HlyD family secretion protein [Thiorhodococcus mannitoliphagus]|uniref:HlyD family secretion protein n=1 Tax=Thiorhodococcus mannitoliphagus TaxID=329406 RepID=A0A6P1E4I1_9GAMM|nr:efflux RND transporter periplasmic adaptor subunit [Thiorhodococcus mannitoliphagus]NEX23442.1 HlyD family secretion protein [Thiorhodococcus mannitoliphagus]